MKDFASLLKRVFISLNRDQLEKESVLYSIKNVTGITLLSSNIFIKNGVLEISATSTIKNEIKIKEEKILNTLKESHKLSYSRIMYR